MPLSTKSLTKMSGILFDFLEIKKGNARLSNYFKDSRAFLFEVKNQI